MIKFIFKKRGQVFCSIVFQDPHILASVTEVMHSFFPFLKYNEDLLMDVLRKVKKS